MTTASLVFGVVALVLGVALIGRGRRLTAVPRPSLSASIVVPARDEATRLPRLLTALGDGGGAEVIVVDDGSRDGTAAVAAVGGATVVEAGPRPDGWTGKAWACARGAAVAGGEVLVFLDADVEPTAAGLDALVAAASHTGGLVSSQPGHRVERLHELASAGPALVTMLGAGTGALRQGRWRWRGPIAFGPAVAVSRTAYEAIGGHDAVAGAVDDDLALARAAADAGVPVLALLGDPLVRYRMYPDGVGRLVEGWTKNLATGAGNIPRVRLLACVAWVGGALGAAWQVVIGPTPVLALVLYAAFALQARVVLRRVGRFGPWPWLLYPMSLLVFLGLFLRSVDATLRKREVRWRGRRVRVGAGAGAGR